MDQSSSGYSWESHLDVHQEDTKDGVIYRPVMISVDHYALSVDGKCFLYPGKLALT
jgi:hypothetical protein